MDLGPFADVPEPQRTALERAARLLRFDAGQLLWRRGDVAPEVLVLQSGLVGVQVAGPDERRLTVATLGAEDVLGEMALAGVPRRTATVVALRDTTAAAFDAGRLRELRQAVPEVDAAVMAVLADTVRRLTDQLLEATLVPQPVRLRRILLRLNRHHEDGRIVLTHEQLAEILGARRSTVTELLAEEVAAGRIATGRGAVRILDLEGLRAAAQG